MCPCREGTMRARSKLCMWQSKYIKYKSCCQWLLTLKKSSILKTCRFFRKLIFSQLRKSSECEEKQYFFDIVNLPIDFFCHCDLFLTVLIMSNTLNGFKYIRNSLLRLQFLLYSCFSFRLRFYSKFYEYVLYNAHF
jgi:hypothetical protein